jgi:hypothetical protein
MIDGVRGEARMQNFSVPLVLLPKTRVLKLEEGGAIIVIMVGESGIEAESRASPCELRIGPM